MLPSAWRGDNVVSPVSCVILWLRQDDGVRNSSPQHVQDRFLVQGEVTHLAAGDRIAHPLEHEEEDRIVLLGPRPGAQADTERGKQRKLTAPLRAVEAPDFRVLSEECRQ